MTTTKMPTKLARKLSKGDKIIVPNGTAKVLDTNNIGTKGLPTMLGDVIHVKVEHLSGPVKGDKANLLFFGDDTIDIVPKKVEPKYGWWNPIGWFQ